jgi:hypothetical protein
MDPIGTAGIGGITTATPQRVFLTHTSDLGKPDELGRSWPPRWPRSSAPATRLDGRKAVWYARAITCTSEPQRPSMMRSAMFG